MKFTWGTGIFLFLVVFLAACTVFIIFASRQQVNLVHKDYYEKGADYAEQMKVDERSKPFTRSFETKTTDDFFVVEIDESLLNKMESGTIHMYRPSDKTKDIKNSFKTGGESVQQNFQFDKETLISGRYILKVTWFMDGTKYEVNRPVNVQ